MKFNDGYKNIKVELKNWCGNDLAKKVFDFGRLSHDFYTPLPEKYDANNPDCIKYIDKVIEGTTMPKYAMNGHRIDFAIYDISRICLAQITRDHAIFASQGGGVFPLTETFNIPLSIYNNETIMKEITEAQKHLEEAYILACENEIPALDARYIGLHCQTISLTASYEPTDFVRSCYSRTSPNFCDECNIVYRKMYYELNKAINSLEDEQSKKLWKWLIKEDKCINDKLYVRERLFNSDFTYDDAKTFVPNKPAINDWRKSAMKLEMERMLNEEPYLLTSKEINSINCWMEDEKNGKELKTTYDRNQKDVLINSIKDKDYYKDHR